MKREQSKAIAQGELPPAEETIRRQQKPEPKMYEPAKTYSPPPLEPDDAEEQPKVQVNPYPLADRLFCDDDAAWRACDLSDDYLMTSLEVFEERLKAAKFPSQDDKDKLRALEQEMQRRTTPGLKGNAYGFGERKQGNFLQWKIEELSDEDLLKISETLKVGASFEDRVQYKKVLREIEKRGLAVG